jgi:hypothetical protein
MNEASNEPDFVIFTKFQCQVWPVKLMSTPIRPFHQQHGFIIEKIT